MSCIYFHKKFGLRGDVYSGVESTLNFFVGVTKNNSKKTYTVEDLNLNLLNAVCNFQSMKSPVELNNLYENSFVISPGLLHHLIRRDAGRLTNEAFTSNTIVSSKQ